MISLSSYSPSSPLNGLTPPNSSSNTPKDRVDQFFKLLDSSLNSHHGTVGQYQKKWIAQNILTNNQDSKSNFAAGCHLYQNDRNLYTFHFEVIENDIEMQIFEKKKHPIPTGNIVEEYFLGAVPQLTFNDFRLVFF